MVKRKHELVQNHYENMRGGRLSVHAVKFLEAEDSCGAGSFFGHAVIPPGGSIGRHSHTGETEVYYILKGTAKIYDNTTNTSCMREI
jgi:mannose-6-phosphate isomerase-like protein (cupin superfamily)